TPKKEAKQTKKEITMVEKATSLVKKFKQELDTAEEHNNTLVKLAAPTTKTDNLEPILDINQLFLHTKELYKTAHKTFNKSKNNKTVIIKSFEQRDKSFKFPKIQNVSYLNENTWKIALKLATTNNTSYKAIVTRALKETKEITAVINLAIKSPIGITYNNEIYDYTVSEFTKFKKNNKAILNIGLKDVNTGKTGTKEGGIIFAEKKYEYADVALKKAMKTAEELHFIKSDF
ncbi:hypothetical protein KAH94_06270, partial [bacterium]|nr:hypothetical protein [bacterium]